MFKVCDYADLFLLARKKSAKTSSTNRNRPNVVSNSAKASSKHREKRPDRPSLEGGQPIIIHIGSMRPFVGRLYFRWLMQRPIVENGASTAISNKILNSTTYSG